MCIGCIGSSVEYMGGERHQDRFKLSGALHLILLEELLQLVCINNNKLLCQ